MPFINRLQGRIASRPSRAPLARKPYLPWAVMVATVLAFAGCASSDKSNNNNGNSMSKGGQDPRLAPRNDFERRQDPPLKAETHFAAGRVAESQDDPKRAIEQYHACLKLDPRHKDALYRLGIVQASLKHLPEAIIAFKKYAEVTDGDAAGYSDLGFAYELAGQPKDAEAAYQKGIAKDPHCQTCRVNYGLMLARANRMTEATIQLQTVLSPAEIHYNLASVYEMQGRRESARAEYQKALDADANLTDALVRMSALH